MNQSIRDAEILLERTRREYIERRAAAVSTTPRTDAATAGVDFFVTDSDQRAYSATDYECLRDKMKKLERELYLSNKEREKQQYLAVTRGEALEAAKAEAERLREALKPKIMPSVGVAIGARLRDFYKNRFALVNPVQHTDNERQVILAALESLLAALAATRKEEGNG